MSKTGGGKPPVDPPDEGDEFAREMADVVPLRKDPRGRVRAAAPVHVRRSIDAPQKHLTESIDGTHDDSYTAPGVSRREIKKLKRGEYEPEAEQDLHALSAADASARTMQFIDRSRHRHRCVVIIHGRGANSRGGVPVVKPRVRDLLRKHPAVLAFADAPPARGGAGAVVVLLRRHN